MFEIYSCPDGLFWVRNVVHWYGPFDSPGDCVNWINLKGRATIQRRGAMTSAPDSYISVVSETDEAVDKAEWAEITKHEKAGHSTHCAKRIVWGDGECECEMTAAPGNRIESRGSEYVYADLDELLELTVKELIEVLKDMSNETLHALTEKDQRKTIKRAIGRELAKRNG